MHLFVTLARPQRPFAEAPGELKINPDFPVRTTDVSSTKSKKRSHPLDSGERCRRDGLLVDRGPLPVIRRCVGVGLRTGRRLMCRHRTRPSRYFRPCLAGHERGRTSGSARRLPSSVGSPSIHRPCRKSHPAGSANPEHWHKTKSCRIVVAYWLCHVGPTGRIQCRKTYW